MSSKQFDATLKDLVEQDAVSWAVLAGCHGVRRVRLIDADVSTLTAAADKVFRVETDHGEELLDLEPESRYAADLPPRLHLYATVLGYRHELPVRSVALLLRREANASNLTGVLEVRRPGESEPYNVFRYAVIRVWELPTEPLLTGGLGLLPLAPLTDEAATDLIGVVARVENRLRAEASPDAANKLRMATFVLFGLRYKEDLATQLFRGVTVMEESTTYQMIMARGRLLGKREDLLLQGREKFGPPDGATVERIQSITDPQRLEQLLVRLLQVSDWQELLAAPPT
jgi:predicted transposase YdaD